MRGRVGKIGLWCAAGIGALAVTIVHAAEPIAAKPDYLGQWIALIEESQKDIADRPNGWVALREAIRRYEANREKWDDEALERWPDGAVDFIMLTADEVEPKYAQTMEATRWALGEAERAGVFAPLEELARTPRAVFEREAVVPTDFLGYTIEGLGTQRQLASMLWGRSHAAIDRGDWPLGLRGFAEALAIGRAVDQQLLLIHALVGRSLWRQSLSQIPRLTEKPGFEDACAATLSGLIFREIRPTPWESTMRGEAIYGEYAFDGMRLWTSRRPDSCLNLWVVYSLRVNDSFEDLFEDLYGNPAPRFWRSVRMVAARGCLTSPLARALMLLPARREASMCAFVGGMRTVGRAMDEPHWRRPESREVARHYRAGLAWRETLSWNLIHADPFVIGSDEAARQTDRLLCQRDAILLMLAVERHKMRHGGALPTTIEAIDADLIPPSMIDQATGEALKYRLATAEEAAAPGASGWGYVIYSVGADKKDDGGRFESGKDAPYGFYETKPGFDFPLVGAEARR